jgi:hypothetical protein
MCHGSHFSKYLVLSLDKIYHYNNDRQSLGVPSPLCILELSRPIHIDIVVFLTAISIRIGLLSNERQGF